MDMNKLTIKAQETIQEAVNLARRGGQQALEPEHLLAAILKQGEHVCDFLFGKLGVNKQALQRALDSQLQSLPRVQGGEPYLSRGLNEVLDRAEDIAQRQGDQ